MTGASQSITTLSFITLVLGNAGAEGTNAHRIVIVLLKDDRPN